MTTTEIVKADAPPAIIVADRPPTSLLPTRGDLEAMALIAGQAIKATGMIPASIKTKEQALAILLAGWELGLRPMTALRHVYVVNGKTEIETRAMVGIIRARDKSIQFAWPEYSQEAVTCEMSRPGQPVTRVRYTVEDAKKAGQMEKAGPWRSYTRDMLYAAATKRACRLGAPDLINAIEGAMQTEAEAVSLMMPDAQVRVLDESDAPAAEGDGIPASAFNDGDEGEIPAEVEAPDPKILAQQVLDDIKRARAEWNAEDFALWAAKIRTDFPNAFTDTGKPKFAELDAATMTTLAERVRKDVGEPPAQGSLV